MAATVIILNVCSGFDEKNLGKDRYEGPIRKEKNENKCATV